ncbi:putative transcriptional regulator [Variovorax sp. WDL1]|uniref:helix-turn-helix transcriptional regulator n=2 Tax=Variovorax TaxID=34072 RepID=UPI00076BC397|nr:AlpA family phage regulatory protein [Variovorax sp. WDL1]KWT73974.1 hypothetical protein APY03_5825 [Variovorax sp. WDL1]PNG52310.1 hypothetical protein CHC07_04682 [Variovorax sp. B4]PNG54850.1 hypothetical protein CHC06_03648 [Variovorax sp. B2]VTV15861.1 putative transcriptional regulator [Variovorax sp. WDL1]
MQRVLLKFNGGTMKSEASNPSPGQPSAKRKGTVLSTPGGPRWTKGDRVQPLALLSVDYALLTTATVIALTGDSVSTIDRKVKGGRFPQPISHGERGRRWVAWQVREHLRKQAEAHGVVCAQDAPADASPLRGRGRPREADLPATQ